MFNGTFRSTPPGLSHAPRQYDLIDLTLPHPTRLRSVAAQAHGTQSTRQEHLAQHAKRKARAERLRMERLPREAAQAEAKQIIGLIETAAYAGRYHVGIAQVALADCVENLVKARIHGMADGWEEDLPGKVRSVVDILAELSRGTPGYRFAIGDHDYTGPDRVLIAVEIRLTWK